MKLINRPSIAVTIPALAGFGFAALSVKGFHFYGWSLFLGVPLVVSFVSAFCTAFRRNVSFGAAYGVAALSLLLLGALIMLMALDGLICLLMALPLALLLALAGVFFGRELGMSCNGRKPTTIPVLILLGFPGLVAFDRASVPPTPLRSVTTTIEIDAPIAKVWGSVIAFPPITDPPKGIFRLGIAYPKEAHIEGTGVGAIRHCVFSTGSFVEPITEWTEPSVLAFDVASNPPPMEELSIYEHLETPHLHGHMESERGEFRLTERDGRVILQGTTWYRHSLSPQWYWGPVSDAIIHRIHDRVLQHIKRVAEKE